MVDTGGGVGSGAGLLGGGGGGELVGLAVDVLGAAVVVVATGRVLDEVELAGAAVTVGRARVVPEVVVGSAVAEVAVATVRVDAGALPPAVRAGEFFAAAPGVE